VAIAADRRVYWRVETGFIRLRVRAADPAHAVDLFRQRVNRSPKLRAQPMSRWIGVRMVAFENDPDPERWFRTVDVFPCRPRSPGSVLVGVL